MRRKKKSELQLVAEQLVAKGKGILAADESTGTIEKRFASINLESTEKNRRDWRELLFTTKDIERFISGVILYDETLRQSSGQAFGEVPFPKLLMKKGILPGIKVDKGAKPLANFEGEVVTEGLDGLRERLEEYVKLGAKFAKWRGVIAIGPNMPSEACIEANAEALARYAALAQEAGVVPIVEPEVLMEGEHTIDRCADVTKKTLKSVFAALKRHKVNLKEMLLKPNMVIAGKDGVRQASGEKIAEMTLKVFNRVVPTRVPGIVFLSGGQTPDQATENLRLMNSQGRQPWELSYSYGRALQDEALKTWMGKETNLGVAQTAFYLRAEKVAMARDGK